MGALSLLGCTYSCAHAFTYLLTYLHSWLCAYKTGNIPETVKTRRKVTINGLYKVVHGLDALPPVSTLSVFGEQH